MPECQCFDAENGKICRKPVMSGKNVCKSHAQVCARVIAPTQKPEEVITKGSVAPTTEMTEKERLQFFSKVDEAVSKEVKRCDTGEDDSGERSGLLSIGHYNISENTHLLHVSAETWLAPMIALLRKCEVVVTFHNRIFWRVFRTLKSRFPSLQAIYRRYPNPNGADPVDVSKFPKTTWKAELGAGDSEDPYPYPNGTGVYFLSDKVKLEGDGESTFSKEGILYFASVTERDASKVSVLTILGTSVSDFGLSFKLTKNNVEISIRTYCQTYVDFAVRLDGDRLIFKENKENSIDILWSDFPHVDPAMEMSADNDRSVYSATFGKMEEKQGGIKCGNLLWMSHGDGSTSPNIRVVESFPVNKELPVWENALPIEEWTREMNRIVSHYSKGKGKSGSDVTMQKLRRYSCAQWVCASGFYNSEKPFTPPSITTYLLLPTNAVTVENPPNLRAYYPAKSG